MSSHRTAYISFVALVLSLGLTFAASSPAGANAGIGIVGGSSDGRDATTTAPRVVFTSDQGVILPGAGNSYQFTAVLEEPDGTLVPAQFSWASSAGSMVSVDQQGLATSLVTLGSAGIVASYPGAIPAQAFVTVAPPSPGTTLVQSGDVISIGPAQAVLDANPVTVALVPGDIVVSGDRGGLLVLVTGVNVQGSEVILSTVPTSLPEAFANLDIRVTGLPTADMLEEDASDGAFACQTTVGGAANLDLNGRTVTTTFTPQLIAVFKVSGGTVQHFELAAHITATVAVSTGSIQFDVNGHVELLCSEDLPEVNVFSAIFIGPIALSGDVRPSFGIIVTADASANLTLAGPEFTVELEATDGIRYTNAGGWQSVIDNTISGLDLIPPQFNISGGMDITVSGYVRADANVKANIGFCPGFLCIELGGADLAYAQVRGDLNVSMHSPLSKVRRGYTGPQWDTGLNVQTGTEVVLTGPIAKLLTYLGVSPALAQWTDYNQDYPRASSPTPSVSVNPSLLPTSGSTTTLTATVPPGHAGELVQFCAFKESDTTCTVIASASVSGTDAVAVWTPTLPDDNGRYQVTALLSDFPFGPLGFPNASSPYAPLNVGPPVGGIVNLPVGAPASADGSGSPLLLVSSVAAALAALAVSGWYVRRRSLR